MDWNAEIVGRMRQAKIKGVELAKEAGITTAWLSTVLNRDADAVLDDTKERINAALARLEDARSAIAQEGDAG